MKRAKAFWTASCFLIIACLYCLLTLRQESLQVLDSAPYSQNTVKKPPVTFPPSPPPSLVYNASDMYTFVEDAFHGQFCRRILRGAAASNKNYTKAQAQTQPVGVTVSFGCQDLFDHNHYGTGNFVMSIYILRSTAQAIGNVDLLIQCPDAEERQSQLILPWLTGWFRHHEQRNKTKENETVFQRCKRLKQEGLSAPLAQRAQDIRFDLRRMAVALVGIPSPDHPAASFNPSLTKAQNFLDIPRQPLVPNTQLDDAVIHFRCGDLIDSNEPRYGFLKFDSFARHISPAAQSIGIVTEPFQDTDQHRSAESSPVTRQRCRLVVTALVQHLQDRFPQARKRVAIRNTDDSIALTYARMVMANQTIVGTSTFGFFPAVASFGQAYARKPRDLGSWIQGVPGIVLFDDPDWLTTRECQRSWGQDGTAVLEWFRSPTTIL